MNCLNVRTESFSNSRYSVVFPPHLSSHDDLIRLVIFEGQWIDTLWPFELDLGDRREEFAFGFLGAGFSHDLDAFSTGLLRNSTESCNHKEIPSNHSMYSEATESKIMIKRDCYMPLPSILYTACISAD